MARPEAPTTTTTRFAEISIRVGSTTIDCRTVDDDLAAMLRVAPGSFNRLRWPAGASRSAHVRLLLTAADLAGLVSALGSPGIGSPVQLVFGGIGALVGESPLCDRMFIPRHPGGAWWSELGRGLFAVDLVDERHFWNNGPALLLTGFNVTLDDKEELYQVTTSSGFPHNFYSATQEIIGSLAPFATLSEFDLPTSGRFVSTEGLKDFFTVHQPHGRVMDRLLATAGMVLRALPRPIGGKRYHVGTIESGVDFMDAFLLEHATSIVHLGPLAMAGTGGLPPAIQEAVLVGDLLNEQIPSSITVSFPTAMKGGGPYRRDAGSDQEGFDYVPGRFHNEFTNAGQPAGFAGNGQSVALWDSEWAIFEEDPPGTFTLTNQAAISARAAQVAAAYYGRFSSGAGGEIVLAGVLVPDSGLPLEVEWVVSTFGGEGVWTKVRGAIDDPIHGWRHDGALTSYGVLSIGNVRALPRPDGGLLLDSPVSRSPFHVGRITAVFGAVNATYSAEAVDDPSVKVVNRAPDDRYTSPGLINHPARLVGGYCVLVETFEKTNPVKLWAIEQGNVGACPQPTIAAPEVDPALVAAAHGF